MPQDSINYNEFSLVATVGTLLDIALYGSHLTNVNNRRRLLQQGLGSMNPYLDLYSVSSQLIWLIYGFMMNNWYVMFNRIVGTTLYIYYVATGIMIMGIYWSKLNVMYANADPSSQEKYLLNAHLRQMKIVQFVFVAIILLWILVFAIMSNGFQFEEELFGKMAGYHSNGYYLIRTPHLYIIARSRDARTIILPNLIADMTTCLCWLNYGLSIKNTAFIYPNAIGFCYCTVYFIFFFLYRNRDRTSATPDADGVHNVDEMEKAKKENVVEGAGVEMSLVGKSADADAGLLKKEGRSRTTSNQPLSAQDKEGMAASGGILSIDADLNLQGGKNMSIKTSTHGNTATDDSMSGSSSGYINPSSGGGADGLMPMPMESPTRLRSDSYSGTNQIMSLLDTSMEYLMNIGRSRANSLFIDPSGAASAQAVSLEKLVESIELRAAQAPQLTAIVCTVCNSQVVSNGKYCWCCGAIINRPSRSYSSQRGEYSDLRTPVEHALPVLEERLSEDRVSITLHMNNSMSHNSNNSLGQIIYNSNQNSSALSPSPRISRLRSGSDAASETSTGEGAAGEIPPPVTNISLIDSNTNNNYSDSAHTHAQQLVNRRRGSSLVDQVMLSSSSNGNGND